ncbi:aspartyl-phosphate phosphatase Spo0E family protein [Bacillaceae bacterium S4-13-56]
MYKKSDQHLQLRIEKKRNEMIRTAKAKGIRHKSTLKCSQELDYLLNKLKKEHALKS